LPYTIEAETIYQSLSTKTKRIGTQDCRIAAVASSEKYILVTANVADFQKIRNIQIEDWTQ
jgi:tRNA(fMet)-specific endonuclease VapC